MERKKASDFPQELLNLFDGYVHGGISRREFLDGAQKFAVGGVTAAALLEMLKPNYAWAIQVPPDDKRIKTEYDTVPSPQGNGSIKGYLVRPANAAKLPAVLVVHENRGLNPYIEDVARRLAVANFIAFAPDGLTSVGGYPGDDEKGLALFSQVDGGKMTRRFLRRGDVAEIAPGQHRQARRRRLLLRRRRRQSARGADGLRSRRRGSVLWRPARAPPTRPRSRRRSMRNTASSTRASPTDGRRSMPRSPPAHVPHEGHIYKGANHGFHNDTTPRYDEAAAKEAWQQLDWFNKYLKG